MSLHNEGMDGSIKGQFLRSQLIQNARCLLKKTQLSAKMQRINLAGTKGGFAEQFNGVMQSHLSS